METLEQIQNRVDTLAITEPEVEVDEPIKEESKEKPDDEPVKTTTEQPTEEDTTDESDVEVAEESEEKDDEEQEEQPPTLDDQKTTVKVDGEEQEVTVKDLRDAYQLKQYSHKLINDTRKYAESLNNFATRIQDINEVGGLLEQIHGREWMIKQAENLLLDHYGLQKLQNDNPQEYQRQMAFKQEQATLKQQQEELKQQQEQINATTVEQQRIRYEQELPNQFEDVGLKYTPETMRDVYMVVDHTIKQIRQQYGDNAEIDVDKILTHAIQTTKQKYDDIIKSYQQKQPERDLKQSQKLPVGKVAEKVDDKEPKKKVRTPNKTQEKTRQSISQWNEDFKRKFGR